MRKIRTCQDCKREFDLNKPSDADEWALGHTCRADLEKQINAGFRA